VKNPKLVTFVSLALIMDVLLEKSGLRQINHVTEGSFYKRHKEACFHVFRKYLNTFLTNRDINVTIKEILV